MNTSEGGMKAYQETMEVIQEIRQSKAKAIQNKIVAKADTTVT
jgi:hypothetical protein